MRIIVETLDENYLEIVLTEKELDMIDDGDVLSKEVYIYGKPINLSVRTKTFFET